MTIEFRIYAELDDYTNNIPLVTKSGLTQLYGGLEGLAEESIYLITSAMDRNNVIHPDQLDLLIRQSLEAYDGMYKSSPEIELWLYRGLLSLCNDMTVTIVEFIRKHFEGANSYHIHVSQVHNEGINDECFGSDPIFDVVMEKVETFMHDIE